MSSQKSKISITQLFADIHPPAWTPWRAVCCSVLHPVTRACGWQGVTRSQQSFKVGHHSGLGISHSPKAGCHMDPRGSKPGARHPLSEGSKSSRKWERELPWAKSWGRKRQEKIAVQFTNCKGSVGGEDLVVNRNRWASSQERRWKKKKWLSLGGWWELRLGSSEKAKYPPVSDKFCP